MFGKRKTVPGSPASEAPASAAASGPGQAFGPATGSSNHAPPVEPFSASDAGPSANVIVPRSAVDAVRADEGAYDLVQAVINFVNTMFDHGLYGRDELVQAALQAYHADYYLAQVNNGGHSQFIHNCGANAPYTFADARAALAAMGAHAQLDCLEKMIAWVDANPEEARNQSGFDGGRADELDELDTAFYEAEKVTPMIGASTRWILQWPELRLVEDADYEQAMNHLALMNPARDGRLVTRRIGSFERQINDWLLVSIGMAASACVETEVRLGIGGGSIKTVEGEEQMVWTVQTNNGRRYGVSTKQGARLYECVEAENQQMPEFGDTEGMKAAIRDGRLANYKPALVGPCLSHIEADQIAEVIHFANRFKAAAAIDLLLRQIGIDDGTVPLTARGVSRNKQGAAVVDWIVVTETASFFAITAESGAMLIKPEGNQTVASVRADDIARHAELNEG